MSKFNKVRTNQCPGTKENGQKNFLNFLSELKDSIATAIAESGFSRGEISGKVSELIGRDINLGYVDNVCAPSKFERIPHIDFVLGVCLVTRSIKPIQVMGRYLPHTHVLQDKEALEYELYDMEKQMQEIIKKQAIIKKQLGKDTNDNGQEIQTIGGIQ